MADGIESGENADISGSYGNDGAEDEVEVPNLEAGCQTFPRQNGSYTDIFTRKEINHFEVAKRRKMEMIQTGMACLHSRFGS